MRCYLLILFILLLPITSLLAQEESSSEADLNSLLAIHYALETVDNFVARDVLSREAGAEQIAYYLEQARLLTGETLTREEIAERAFANLGTDWLRFLSFVNILWVFASIIIVLSAAWLFKLYLLPLLKRIPIWVYEILLYLACIAFIYGGQFASDLAAQFVALPGILGLGLLLPFSYGRRVKSKPTESERFEDHQTALVLQNLVLTIIWGAVAIAYHSQLIGFLTVLAFLGALTLSRAVPSVLRVMGFQEKSPALEIMAMSFGLLLVYLVAEIQGIIGIYEVFELGVHWLGAYGFFGALEWMSAKWQHRDNPSRYFRWQIYAIFFGVLGLFLGVYFEVDSLQEVAGTYLLIYILSKYIEIPNWKRHWAWASLGLGALLYTFALLMNQYPQFFLLG